MIMDSNHHSELKEAFKNAFYPDVSKIMTLIAYCLPLIFLLSVVFLVLSIIHYKTRKPNLLAPYGSIYKTGTTLLVGAFNLLSIVFNTVVLIFLILKHFPFHFYWIFFFIGFMNSVVQIISCLLTYLRFKKTKTTKGTRNGIADTFFVLSVAEMALCLAIFVLLAVLRPAGGFSKVLFIGFSLELVIRGCLTFTIHRFMCIMNKTIEVLNNLQERSNRGCGNDSPNEEDLIVDGLRDSSEYDSIEI